MAAVPSGIIIRFEGGIKDLDLLEANRIGKKGRQWSLGGHPDIREGSLGGFRQETKSRVGTTAAILSRRSPPSGRQSQDGDHEVRMTQGAPLHTERGLERTRPSPW